MGSDRAARWSGHASRVARLVSTNKLLAAGAGDCGGGEEEEGGEGTGWRGASGRGIRPG